MKATASVSLYVKVFIVNPWTTGAVVQVLAARNTVEIVSAGSERNATVIVNVEALYAGTVDGG